jgi:hypothetical protein
MIYRSIKAVKINVQHYTSISRRLIHHHLVAEPHYLLSHVLKKEGDHLKLPQRHSNSPSVFLCGKAQPNSETSTKHPNKLESFKLLLHQPSMLNNGP